MIQIQNIVARIDEKKKKLDAARPLPPALVNNLDEWFKIEFTYTSNAIEGNTLSHSETALVIEKGITIGGKTVQEHLEAVNHAQAVDFIKNLARKNRADLAIDDILAIHKIVLQKIDDLNAGVFRKSMVRVMGSPTIFPNYAKVPVLMVEFMQWLHTTTDHPIIIAAVAHFKLVNIHPFIDGNGRTARLLMNLLLLQKGYPLAIIKTKDRSTYIKAIEQARNNNDFEPFYRVILKAVEYSLDAYLEAIAESDLTA
jgi:Fic family protein